MATATLSVTPTRRPARRARVARLERPLLAGGLALVAAHLLDLAHAGPDTTVLGVLGILAAPLLWLALQPRLIRPTRVALGVAFGLLTVGFGVASHGLHVVNSGFDWPDLTGVGMIAGGLLLVASGSAALAAPRRAPRRPGLGWRAAHGAGWLVGAAVIALAFLTTGVALMATHAPRWAISESALGVAHEEVRVPTADGRKLSAWLVPSRNGATVLLSHGSGGSRGRLVGHVRMLARNGFGVLALDLAGNGESEGRSNGLGYNAQPAIDAALDYLVRRPDVDPGRIAGFGSSLGGEVLLEAAARDSRLRAVISDGAARPQDARVARDPSGFERLITSAGLQAIRGISGMRPASALTGLMPRIAPRPVQLIAGDGDPAEIPTNRRYRDAGGPGVELWELSRTGHTAGLRTRPAEYEQRTIAFLERSLGVRRDR